LKIAICDDDISFTGQLEKYVKKKGAQMQETILQVSVYHSGEDFLQDIECGESFNIVFMDIEMGAMNGIAAGHQFRRISDSDEVVIVYISNHDSFSDELLEVGNVRFVKKPYSEEKLDIAFGRAVAQAIKYIEKAPQKFLYTTYKDSASVNTDKIVYLKSTKNTISIYAWDSSEKSIQFFDKFYSTVPEVLKNLPQESFFRCERSHIVNLLYVQKIWTTAFVLSDNDDTEIPIGKTYRQEAKEAFFSYRGRQHGRFD